MWQYLGNKRPEFAVPPGPGQESVWDYPRPPRIVPCDRLVEVRHGERLIAQSDRCLRVLETASPPNYYLPPESIDLSQLKPANCSSICEWKGIAKYWALTETSRPIPVGWSYANPNPAFNALMDWISFYPSRVSCFVAGQKVRAQASEFYGGWITDEITGPFKGDPGTGHW